MKTKSFAVIVLGTAVVALCRVGVCFPQTSNAQTDSAPAPAPDGSTAPDDSSALPPNIYPSSPLAQVIRLTQAGVSEDVILDYVNNSSSTFNLDPDKIIYLKDIGAPDDLVTAMMQRDQVLQAQMAASANQPPPQPASAPASTAPDTSDVTPPTTEVTVDYFYNTLAPYGTWVDVDGYGRCWRPTVVVYNSAWQPYGDHGHWVYTDDGWYWMSDYSWGWAPFHYGRWFRDARFGWCWYPDTVWGPSWVTWRYSDDYCGWAPLPPRCEYREGLGFFYNGAAVSIGFDFGLGVDCFTFVSTRDFCDPHPWRHRVESREMTQIYNRTTVINNFDVDRRNGGFINHGIDPQRITQVTHAQIHQVAIRDTAGPGARGEQIGSDGRTLVVNRPHFSDNPRPSNRDAVPHTGPSSPVVGSPYQPPHNGNENNNSQPQNRYQLAQTAPAQGNHYAPITPVQPSAPNYNSTDNRRYPSPKAQQVEQQSPWANPSNSGGRVGAPANPPEANRYTSPVEQPAPAQPPQREYVPPQNETPPAESRPNYSQPNAGDNQSHSAPPASSSPAQSQNSGKGKNQNGQQ
jgi:hypothetical protein